MPRHARSQKPSPSTTKKRPAWLEQAAQEAYRIAQKKVEGTAEQSGGIVYTPYGVFRDVWNYDGRELLVSGGAGTGKTLFCLQFAHRNLQAFPRSRALLVRKTRASLSETALVTYEEKVLGPDHPILQHPIQRSHRTSYNYTNRSRLVVGGLDKPHKIMSSEYDMIIIPEATELEEVDLLALLTRLRHGRMPLQQIIADCNPASPMHWLYRRAMSGRMRLQETTHRDNPDLWDEKTGDWTEKGKIYVFETLGSLTGVERARLLEGKWIQAEGIVFDTWQDGGEGASVTEEADYVPNGGDVVWAVDDGYSPGSFPHSKGIDPNSGLYAPDSHPRVILICQIKDTGHLDVVAENYACMKLSDEQIKEVLIMPYTVEEFERIAEGYLRERMDFRKPMALPADGFRLLLDGMVKAGLLPNLYPSPEYAVHGPGAAEIRGRLFAASIYPRQSKGAVAEGIKITRSRMAQDRNGVRLLRVHPRCKHLRGEMLSYVYAPGSDVPVKQFDHGPDALRVLAWSLRYQFEEISEMAESA